MLFKLYISKSEYTEKLNAINEKLGFPSKKYSKIINGKRQHFVADRVMTRTWANENPIPTKQNQYALPIDEEMKKEFTELVEYNKEWYPVEEIELKTILK